MLTKLDKKNLTIDVVIPVYHPDDKFDNLLSMLSKQTLLPKKVICMYTLLEGQKDSDVRENNDFQNICVEYHYIDKNDFDHGGTRNAGFMRSSADIVISMTCDAVPDDEYLIEKLTEGLFIDNAASCYARQLPQADSSLLEQFSRAFNYLDSDEIKSKEDIDRIGIKAFFCSNVCAAYRRDVFIELEGFPQRTIFNEDMIYARRVIDSGYNIVYKADARVIHSHNYTNLQQLKRNFDLAVSQKMNKNTFEGISSEKEGIRYVVCAGRYFADKKRPLYIIPFVITSGYKYIGYKLGKKYAKLPKGVIRKLSMNPAFFDKLWEEKTEV